MLPCIVCFIVMPKILSQEPGHHYGVCCAKHSMNLICVKDSLRGAYGQRAYGGTLLFKFFKLHSHMMVYGNKDQSISDVGEIEKRC